MNWLVIGAGISGAAAAKWLKRLGHVVRVSETKKLSSIAKLDLEGCGCEVFDEGHHSSHLDNIESVLVSPGLAPSHPLLVLAREKSIPIVSEIDLGLGDYQGQLIAVTGTNGKSTNCSMLAHILNHLQRPAALTGNIGTPPCALKLAGELPPYVVVELSSYQLEQSLALNPTIAIFTNFADDHLGRHGTREGYFRAKWSMIESLKPGGLAILSSEVVERARQYGFAIPTNKMVLVDKDPSEGEFALREGNLIIDSLVKVPMAPAKLTFPHNLINAAVSITAVSKLLNHSAIELPQCLATFKSLPHRCENLGTWNGCSVFDDSKATNVASVEVALSGLKGPLYLLLGGRPKGESFEPLLRFKDRISQIFLFGEAGQQIENEVGSVLRSNRYRTLSDAIRGLIVEMQESPQTVLFSPGCASFDEFDNFAARGDFFQQQLSALLD